MSRVQLPFSSLSETQSVNLFDTRDQNAQNAQNPKIWCTRSKTPKTLQFDTNTLTSSLWNVIWDDPVYKLSFFGPSRLAIFVSLLGAIRFSSPDPSYDTFPSACSASMVRTYPQRSWYESIGKNAPPQQLRLLRNLQIFCNISSGFALTGGAPV
jgi:hypothetical protein